MNNRETYTDAISGTPTKRNQIEISTKKKQQIEHTLQGQLHPKPNHRIWQINITTEEITEAKFEQTAVLIPGKKTTPRMIINKGCIYIPALNKINALKKFRIDRNQSNYYNKQPNMVISDLNFTK